MLDQRGISNFPPIRPSEPPSAAERVAAATASEKVEVRALRPQEAGAPSAARLSATRVDRVFGASPVRAAAEPRKPGEYVTRWNSSRAVSRQ